jgi:hypothetical protein
VQIQLQCLVRNHHLELSEGPKVGKFEVDLMCGALKTQRLSNEILIFQHDLPGFYDPAMGEPKRLRIHYFFGGKRHLVEVDEQDSLHLPSPGMTLIEHELNMNRNELNITEHNSKKKKN